MNAANKHKDCSGIWTLKDQFSPRSMYLYLTQATKESDSKKRTLKRVQKGYPDPLFFLDFGPVQKGYPDVLMSHINVL